VIQESRKAYIINVDTSDMYDIITESHWGLLALIVVIQNSYIITKNDFSDSDTQITDKQI